MHAPRFDSVKAYNIYKIPDPCIPTRRSLVLPSPPAANRSVSRMKVPLQGEERIIVGVHAPRHAQGVCGETRLRSLFRTTKIRFYPTIFATRTCKVMYLYFLLPCRIRCPKGRGRKWALGSAIVKAVEGRQDTN